MSTDLHQSLNLLPAEKRFERYRELADAAFLKAKRARTPEQKTEYLSMAAEWHALATRIERGPDDSLPGEAATAPPGSRLS